MIYELRLLFYLLFVALCPIVSSAATLLVSQGAGQTVPNDSHYYYGGSRWPQLTQVIDQAFDSVTVAPDLTNLDQLLAHDRLWVDSRSFYGPNLSPTEVSNLQTFIATGRRVVMMGERGVSWSSVVLSVVGGSWAGEGRGTGPDNLAIPLNDVPELIAGVGPISFAQDSHGVANGGIPLFEPNWATLWGDNVVTLLDVTVWLRWTAPSVADFGSNVVAWLAVPEPTTMTLLSAFLAIGSVVRFRTAN